MNSNTLWKPGRLVDAIEGGPSVVFVCAPAGYGKSSLVKAYAVGQSRPVVWISADMRDADPVRLVSHLFAATGAEAASISLAGNPLATMINLSEMISDELVIIDDAHLIAPNPGSAECLNELISHRAQNSLPLIVTSRKLDNLRASNWVMNGSASVLGTNDLSWTEGEIGDYLAELHSLNVSPEELEQIQGLADGWPICISLMAQIKVGQPTQSWGSIVGNAATSPHLEQYLTDEVIGTLGHLEFEGLVACAQEDEIAPEILIDSGLLAEDTWNAITETGLVALAGIQEGTSNRFVMHQLIKSHIQTIAGQPSFNIDLCKILLTLGETWANHGFALESSQHFISAESWDNAASQLTEALPEMWAVGESEFVLSLMEQIPPNMASPELLLYKVRFLRSVGRLEDAIACASDVQEASRLHGPDDYVKKAEVLIWQTHRFIGSLKHESILSRELHQADALDLRDTNDFELTLQATFTLLVQGEMLAFMKQARRIRRAAPPTSTYLGARFASLLGFAQAWAIGRPDRALSTLEPVLEFFCDRDYEQYCQNLSNVVQATAELDVNPVGLVSLRARVKQIENHPRKSHFLEMCTYVGQLEFSLGNVEYAQSLWMRAINESTFVDQYEAILSMGWTARLGGDSERAVSTLQEFAGHALYRSIELRHQVELAASEWHVDGRPRNEALLVQLERECRANFQRYALVHCLHAQGVERYYSGDHATSIDKLGEAISISKRGKRRFWLRAEAQSDPAPLSECLRHDIETEFLAPILVRAGEPVAKHLAHTMADWRPAEKVRALEVMGAIGDRKSVAALRREALSDDESVRQAARDAINKVSLEVDGALEQLKVGFTAREADVLALLADGQSNGEIANSLFLSGGTVKTYVNRLFHKLGVTTRMQAAKRYNDAIARDAD